MTLITDTRSDSMPPITRPRICTDVHAPILSGPGRGPAGSGMIGIMPHAPNYAILVKASKWSPGTKIGINFLSGSQAQHDLVVKAAQKWLDATQANLAFAWGLADGQVRITFDELLGAWSYIATECLYIPKAAATMNFGWLDEAVVLHEFGHMLGLGHEHSSPLNNPIRWNEAKVIADLKGPPNNWDEATIRSNVFERYKVDQVNGSVFDPMSIMLYAFPSAWTMNGVSTHENSALSPGDIALIKSEYPAVAAKLAALPVSRLVVLSGEVAANKLTEYELTVLEPGTYTIETEGTTDVLMRLYQGEKLLAEDDDSGDGANSKIVAGLAPGKYKVSIRHYNAVAGKGPFKLKCLQS